MSAAIKPSSMDAFMAWCGLIKVTDPDLGKFLAVEEVKILSALAFCNGVEHAIRMVKHEVERHD